MERGPDIRFYQVDAFTDTPFSGNPAAVFLLDGPLDPRDMQLVAREMNLSESAFVGPPDEEGRREIRWFTPVVEVSACGHSTLAAGHVLLEEAGLEPPITFVSADGPVSVDAEDGVLSMAFPADPPTIELPPSGLLKALGCHEAVPVLRSRQVWVVRLSWQKEVEALTPHVPRLLEVDIGDGAVGVAVTAPASGDADFVSRFFAPWIGVPEEPVTGVAHTALAPYWAAQLDRDELRARQLSAREGSVKLRYEGETVRALGEAVTVSEGRMRLPPPRVHAR